MLRWEIWHYSAINKLGNFLDGARLSRSEIQKRILIYHIYHTDCIFFYVTPIIQQWTKNRLKFGTDQYAWSILFLSLKQQVQKVENSTHSILNFIENIPPKTNISEALFILLSAATYCNISVKIFSEAFAALVLVFWLYVKSYQ